MKRRAENWAFCVLNSFISVSLRVCLWLPFSYLEFHFFRNNPFITVATSPKKNIAHKWREEGSHLVHWDFSGHDNRRGFYYQTSQEQYPTLPSKGDSYPSFSLNTGASDVLHRNSCNSSSVQIYSSGKEHPNKPVQSRILNSGDICSLLPRMYERIFHQCGTLMMTCWQIFNKRLLYVNHRTGVWYPTSFRVYVTLQRWGGLFWPTTLYQLADCKPFWNPFPFSPSCPFHSFWDEALGSQSYLSLLSKFKVLHVFIVTTGTSKSLSVWVPFPFVCIVLLIIPSSFCRL